MTPIAEMVRVMLERDVPRDVIVTAIEAAERHAVTVTGHALRNVTNHDAKLKAAERAKRYRDKRKRDDAVTPSRDAKTAHILTSSSLTESQEHSEEKKARKTERKKNLLVTLPDGFVPDREHPKSLGWNDQRGAGGSAVEKRGTISASTKKFNASAIQQFQRAANTLAISAGPQRGVIGAHRHSSKPRSG